MAHPEQIGTYRLAKEIGSSRSCRLWQAVDARDGRTVAIKALQSELSASREQIGYLKREFAVGRDLRHKNVIRVHDFGTEDGVPFLVMEYHEGASLKEMIAKRHDWVVYHGKKIVEQAARGLGYMHRQGWLHRDVKPDNYLVDERCVVKLIDFSIARKKRGVFASMFLRDKVQGTRSYMAPEQIRGERLDQRADVYGFGCMIFEMVAGSVPFRAANPHDLLEKHLKTPIPQLTTANEEVTRDFSALVARMMAKQADERPATMEQFLGEFTKMRLFRGVVRRPDGLTTQDAPEGQSANNRYTH